MKKLFLISIAFVISTTLVFAQIDYINLTNHYIDQHISKIKAPGTIIAVIKDDKIIHYRAFGKRDIKSNLSVKNTTLFRIGSLTKTFTATAIVILRERGLLKLDDPAEMYIEELESIKYPYLGSPLITIRHLISVRAHNTSLQASFDRVQIKIF